MFYLPTWVVWKHILLISMVKNHKKSLCFQNENKHCFYFVYTQFLNLNFTMNEKNFTIKCSNLINFCSDLNIKNRDDFHKLKHMKGTHRSSEFKCGQFMISNIII